MCVWAVASTACVGAAMSKFGVLPAPKTSLSIQFTVYLLGGGRPATVNRSLRIVDHECHGEPHLCHASSPPASMPGTASCNIPVSLVVRVCMCSLFRLHDVIHADRRLYLVFEYLDLDLKKLMDGMPTFSTDHRLIKVRGTSSNSTHVVR